MKEIVESVRDLPRGLRFMGGKNLKIGVQRGDGPPPGYRWTVWIPDPAHREARKFLNAGQYQHISMQIKELARQDDPSHSETASVDAIEDYHELRDKGGILGGMNVRVFFYLDEPNKAFVILGAIKKQNDGPTPKPDKIRMARRLRMYRNGEYLVS